MLVKGERSERHLPLTRERSERHLPLTRKPSEGYLFYLTFMLPMFEITTKNEQNLFLNEDKN